MSVIAKPTDYAQSEFAHYESSIDLSAGNVKPASMTRRWHLVGPAARGIRETRRSAGTNAFSEIVHKYNMRGERDNTPVGEARLLDGDDSQGVTVEAEYTLTEPLRIRSGSGSLSYTHTAIHLIDQLPVPQSGIHRAWKALPRGATLQASAITSRQLFLQTYLADPSAVVLLDKQFQRFHPLARLPIL